MKYTGTLLPIKETNVDTDKIIPAQYLTTVDKKGLGKHLFDRVRKENPSDYPLDDPHYAKATVLLCQPNFGCGSSREHAVWAIQDAGFKVLVGSTFLDIFLNNAQLNGLWIIRLPAEIVEKLFAEIAKKEVEVTIDMETLTVLFPWGEKATFPLDPFYQQIFVKGLDPITFLIKDQANAIKEFEKKIYYFSSSRHLYHLDSLEKH